MDSQNSSFNAIGKQAQGNDSNDPLHGMAEAELRRLYEEARGILLLTLPKATAEMIRRGRCSEIVAVKMRQMVVTRMRQLVSEQQAR